MIAKHIPASKKSKTVPMPTKAQFTKMNKKRRIVYLAKDVLHQLKIGKFIAQNGTYLAAYNRNGSRLHYRDMPNASAKDVLNQQAYECFVCAKGALVCSYLKKFNGINYIELSGSGIYDNAELRNIFGPETWMTIEALFEGNHGWKSHTLESIMEHLIENKGVLDNSCPII